MKRFLILMSLLAMMLVAAACGGSDAGRSERADPDEPRRAQAESDKPIAPEETAREEATRKGAPSDDEAAQGEQGSAQEDDESSGLSVTTLAGEQVNLGEQGDVTALYFMAGW